MLREERGTQALGQRELAAALMLHTVARLFLQSRLERGREGESVQGGIVLFKESDPRVRQFKTNALAVRADGLCECSLCMGMSQPSDVLSVLIQGKQWSPV